MLDYSTNGACAAGSGSFLDQQATRLGMAIDELAEAATAATQGSAIAGRCSVFAKSDMIHAQQKGAGQNEILRGLCDALAHNYCATVLKGKTPGSQTVFTGGVARNRSVEVALRQVAVQLHDTLLVPPLPTHFAALGAALLLHRSTVAQTESRRTQPSSSIAIHSAHNHSATLPPLSPERVNQIAITTETVPIESELSVYLGIDIGSVSTNLVCIDEQGTLLREIYLRTKGRPIQAVTECLSRMYDEFGARLNVCGAGTTGSGRELIGELIGADTVNDEITAHATGAGQIAARYLGLQVDTILEIGGQDAKFICLEDGVVVDFAMNEACSAGTGSFLDDQAERLGISICNEFSRLAFSSLQPLCLGERCTVFMEQDIVDALGRGEAKEDLAAGAAYAVVNNYLHRVKGSRQIGEVIFFQGGTAYNHAVAAAFAQVLGMTVHLPPHAGVMGAYGAALLARGKMRMQSNRSSFSGFTITPESLQRRKFTCSACSNRCTINEYRQGNLASYWGNKCGVRFRKNASTGKTPLLADLFKFRETELHRDYFVEFAAGSHGDRNEKDAIAQYALLRKQDTVPCIALSRTMYHFEYFPFWNTYLASLGMKVELSAETSDATATTGITHTVADPCFPVQVAHGHLQELCSGNADFILLPALIDAESDDPNVQSHFCPWGQTLPYVLAASSASTAARGRLLTPIVHFRRGVSVVEQELWSSFAPFAASRQHHRSAVALGDRALAQFRDSLRQAGTAALQSLAEQGERGIIMLGRSYTLYDNRLNLHLPAKLRSRFGVNIIPLDFLPLHTVSLASLSENMFWHSGRRILQGARFTATHPHLHGIWLTHFKCGPDSYIKPLGLQAAEKPMLIIQLDAHSNDTGVLTRCEAYLHSKGLLA
ncbi:MAG: acyl-CoA dehydratase activase [Desulfuromonadaceae bacterium]|nr:acyl-CoA dehydratase activase [Desulfuromonadaceae bacterium]